MTRARRRRPKPGRHLKPVEAATLIELDGELAARHAGLLDRGFHLAKTVRPYLTSRNVLTLRFVWRKRDDGLTIVHELTQRIPLSDILSTADPSAEAPRGA